MGTPERRPCTSPLQMDTPQLWLPQHHVLPPHHAPLPLRPLQHHVLPLYHSQYHSSLLQSHVQQPPNHAHQMYQFCLSTTHVHQHHVHHVSQSHAYHVHQNHAYHVHQNHAYHVHHVSHNHVANVGRV